MGFRTHRRPKFKSPLSGGHGCGYRSAHTYVGEYKACERPIASHFDITLTCAGHAQSRRASVRTCSTSPAHCPNLPGRGSPLRVVLRADSRYTTSSWCEVHLRPCSAARLNTRPLTEQTHDQHGAALELLRTCRLVPRTGLISPHCLLG